MPNIQYEKPTSSSTFVSTNGDSTTSTKKRSISMPRFAVGGIGKKIVILLIFALVIYISAVISGIISALSSNVTITALSVVFDPQITIAYILTYYFLSHFYDMPRGQMYTFFILTLFLSFTVPFIQGAITLMLLPPVLRKLNLIAKPETK